MTRINVTPKLFNYKVLAILFLGVLPGILYCQTCQVNGRAHYNFEDIKIILDRNKCNTCHYKDGYQSDWDYSTYESMTGRTACYPSVITPGRSDLSLLVDKLNGGPTSCGSAMPPGSQRISDADLLAIETWVDSGAPEFCIPDYDKIRSILMANQCQNCHNNQSNWTFGDYEQIFVKPGASECPQPVVEKYNAAGSLLYTKLQSSAPCGNRMLSSNGQPLTDQEVDAVRDWINSGAAVFAKALPVSLKDFSTESDGTSAIIIFWATASEQNIDRFEIETSSDGIRFGYLSTIEPKGNPSSGSDYVYQTEKVQIGFNYFRLKIYDLDGTFTYSPVRVERISNDKEIFSIYPVPVTNDSDFIVEWYPVDGREKARLFIMDIQGKKCAEYVINNGFNHIFFTGLRPGVYYMTIQDYNFHTMVRKIAITEF